MGLQSAAIVLSRESNSVYRPTYTLGSATSNSYISIKDTDEPQSDHREKEEPEDESGPSYDSDKKIILIEAISESEATGE